MAFTSISDQEPMIGHIKISMNAQFLINDGQHRRAAISEAIKKKPALKNEHISVVFYHDQGLRHSQQMFSDLNRYAIRPTRSINILFNSREESSIIAKEVAERVYVFRGLIEKEKTAISNRSKALFTLSAICTSTEQLLDDLEMDAAAKNRVCRRILGIGCTAYERMGRRQGRPDEILGCTKRVYLFAWDYADRYWVCGKRLIQKEPKRLEIGAYRSGRDQLEKRQSHLGRAHLCKRPRLPPTGRISRRCLIISPIYS